MESRIRKIWFNREKFSCKQCGAGNDDICWNDSGSDHPTTEPEEVLFCKKCGHKLTAKDELEELVSIVEELQYGFYLRFASESFIPCEKCQDLIHEEMMGNLVFHDERQQVILETRQANLYKEGKVKIWKVFFGFLEFQPTIEFCEHCSRQLNKIWDTKELHIGNDVKPLVELWRRWEINDEKTEALSKNE